MESNAFSRIAEENMQGLYRLSFSILHTRHDAQDAVQQGLLRAWERRETARPEQIRAADPDCHQRMSQHPAQAHACGADG